jgi:hypothetical protein
MAEPRDDRVSAAYRELPGEGPPASLDAAIQAAARRAVGSKPAAGRRWQKPLSIAAVFMLAIAVTLQVERHKPVVEDGAPVSAGSAEYPVPQQAAPASEASPAAVAPAARAPAAAPAERRQERPVAAPAPAPAPEPAPEPAPAPAPPAPATAPAPEPPAPPAMERAASGAAGSADAMRVAPQAARRAKSELAREATTQEKKMAEAMETPERRLERIADLRAKGLHDEADRELAAFRRDLPGYRLNEEWLRKVERR